MSDAHPPRFLVPGPLSSGIDLDLPEQPARHVAVLRLREGDPITLFCGDGVEYAAVLTLIARRLVRVRLGERVVISRESPLRITLAQCISSGDRMDLTLQKATELGVHCIIPLSSERSIIKLRDERADRRHAHWRHVVAAACEQCGRNSIPEVRPPTDIQTWLTSIGVDEPDGCLRLVLAPETRNSLRNHERQMDVTLLIGPEGGLAEQEVAAATKHSFRPIHLGPRVLRTETAPIAAIAAIQVLWGDLA